MTKPEAYLAQWWSNKKRCNIHMHIPWHSEIQKWESPSFLSRWYVHYIHPKAAVIFALLLCASNGGKHYSEKAENTLPQEYKYWFANVVALRFLGSTNEKKNFHTDTNAIQQPTGFLT